MGRGEGELFPKCFIGGEQWYRNLLMRNLTSCGDSEGLWINHYLDLYAGRISFLKLEWFIWESEKLLYYCKKNVEGGMWMRNSTRREWGPLVGALHTEGEGASDKRVPPHKRSIACKLPVHDQYISWLYAIIVKNQFLLQFSIAALCQIDIFSDIQRVPLYQSILWTESQKRSQKFKQKVVSVGENQ